jgi:hypothetical protein
MIYQVALYHRLQPTFFPVQGELDLADFGLVMRCQFAADTVPKLLETVFRETNTIDEPWYAQFDLPPTRSTSVGDLVQVNDEFWQVDMIGFAKCQIAK